MIELQLQAWIRKLPEEGKKLLASGLGLDASPEKYFQVMKELRERWPDIVPPEMEKENEKD